MERIQNVALPKPIMDRLRDDSSANPCPDCGLMVYPRQVTMGGKVHFVPRPCPCQEDKEKQRRTNEQRAVRMEAQSRNTYSWLGSAWSDVALREKTFATFDARKQAEAYEEAQAFTKDPQGTLVFHGTYGTGKTHLLAAICNELLSRHGKASLFVTAPKLFAAIGGRIAEDVALRLLAIVRGRNPRAIRWVHHSSIVQHVKCAGMQTETRV
jgi:Bacterial dnaA  protein